jgi:1-aminocyclopropane-1-carboxylate deaminase/D-cysteine desulfhydrase-like pyridoxal-dependent ACC family enzyme
LSRAVQSNAIGRDATVVFVHTGGAPIVFAQAAALAPSVPAPA